MTSPARLLLALCATLGASFATLAPVQAAEPELLRIIGEDKKFIVQTAKGPLEITRTMTPCAKNKGWLQPLVPVAGRMDELGCKKLGKGWDCSSAKKVYAFCNGPVCPQSPTAILAMTRDGFPADKIYYYRGGMLDWAALGFPVIKGEF